MSKKVSFWKKVWQELIQRASWGLGSESQVYHPNVKPLSRGKGKQKSSKKR